MMDVRQTLHGASIMGYLSCGDDANIPPKKVIDDEWKRVGG